MNVAAVNDPPPTGTFDRTVVQLSDQSLEQTVLRLSDLPDNVDDGETLRFSAVSIGNATTGTVRVSPEGTEIIFTPATGINASVTDTISFTVTDSGGLSQTGTIDLRVNDYQLRRVAVNFAGRSAAIGLLDSSPRLEGTAIDGTAVSMAASVGADGSVTFDDLAPGNYEVVVPANPFLQGRDAEQLDRGDQRRRRRRYRSHATKRVATTGVHLHRGLPRQHVAAQAFWWLCSPAATAN